jgi:hypothetical protein
MVKWGWKYEINKDPRIPEDERANLKDLNNIIWTTNEEDMFIDALSKGYVIDSAFMTKWGDGSFRVLTSNDAYRPYANENREIEEIYFKIHLDEPMYFRNSNKIITHSNVGFLTQFSEDEEDDVRPNMGITRSNTSEKEAEKVYRQCVSFTPDPKIDKVYGVSKYKNLCATALQKIYNLFYSMLYTHKGGVIYDLVYPEGVDPKIKKNAAKDLKRGMLRSGIGWEVKGIGRDVGAGDLFAVNATTIPTLPFMDTDYLISEESKLSQQEVKGSPESGSLGGNSTEVMADSDDREIDELYNFIEQQILYVNDVFHGEDGYYLYKEDEEEEDTIAEKIPLYTVKFTIPKTNEEEEKDARQDAENSKNGSTQSEKSNEVENAEINSFSTIVEFDVLKDEGETHSLFNGTHITYIGNMLQAGSYLYPDRPKSSKKPREITYTSEEIEDMTKDPVNKGNIETNHSENPLGTRLNNIGYYEVVGFNGKDKDITKFNIKIEEHANLINNGYIVNGKLRISPYFVWDKTKSGKKKLAIQNVGVIHPTMKTRSSLTGLDTSAIRS